jgi:hypothetical protein
MLALRCPCWLLLLYCSGRKASPQPRARHILSDVMHTKRIIVLHPAEYALHIRDLSPILSLR